MVSSTTGPKGFQGRFRPLTPSDPHWQTPPPPPGIRRGLLHTPCPAGSLRALSHRGWASGLSLPLGPAWTSALQGTWQPQRGREGGREPRAPVTAHTSGHNEHQRSRFTTSGHGPRSIFPVSPAPGSWRQRLPIHHPGQKGGGGGHAEQEGGDHQAQNGGGRDSQHRKGGHPPERRTAPESSDPAPWISTTVLNSEQNTTNADKRQRKTHIKRGLISLIQSAKKLIGKS